MLHLKKEGIILEKRALGFELEGVLNPAVIMIEEDIHMFFRAVGKGNYSTIGYCKLSSDLKVVERMDIPLIFPQFDYEFQGVEDPRIVKIDELYYMTYCANDGINALGALATSTDLVHWDKKGIITPQITYNEFIHLAETKGDLNEKYYRYNHNSNNHLLPKESQKVLLWDKNLVLFPRRINGKLHFLHRIKPDIQIFAINDLEELSTYYWQDYLLHFNDSILISSKFDHEVSYVGSGCPPIETQLGWLVIYHGVYDSVNGYIYCACAALLDLENPRKEIARLPYPLFKPEYEWEIHGIVNNICFPTGAIVNQDILYIFYGAADEHIACASVPLSELLKELILNSIIDEK